MNESAINFADFVYRSRLQALQGVDEIVEDVIAMLDEKGVLNNTYSKSPHSPEKRPYVHILTPLQSSTRPTMVITSASTACPAASRCSTTRMSTFPLLYAAPAFLKV
jgi:hypothetical protein